LLYKDLPITTLICPSDLLTHTHPATDTPVRAYPGPASDTPLRLIRQSGQREPSWVCEQRCPSGTWPNRPLWKPLSKPLQRAALINWLQRRFPTETTLLNQLLTPIH